MSNSLGFIFHFSIYVVPAYDDVKSARRRKIANGSEWFALRVTETSTFRPVSGYKETQAYHKENYGDMKYEDFQKDFLKDFTVKDIEEAIDEWMKLIKKANAVYAILTAKHHDGFILYNTKTSSFKSKIDIVDIFIKSALKYDIAPGIYYSWYEFNKSVTKEFVDNVIVPQIIELSKYSINIIFFDGHWACKSKYAKETIIELCKMLKTINPDIHINDRIPDESYKDRNYLGESTFRVYADRHIPDEVPDVPWQCIETVGISWGYNACQTAEDYKTGKDLLELEKLVYSKHGNLLLNLAPDKNGKIDKNEVAAVEEWIKLRE